MPKLVLLGVVALFSTTAAALDDDFFKVAKPVPPDLCSKSYDLATCPAECGCRPLQSAGPTGGGDDSRVRYDDEAPKQGR